MSHHHHHHWEDKNKKRKRKQSEGENTKISHKDVTALLTLQKNPGILQQYQQMPQQQRKRRKLQIEEHRQDTRPREDFLTQCLVRWSVTDLIDTSALLLDVMTQRDCNNYEDTLFADNTTILVSKGDTRSFADYYRLMFQCARDAEHTNSEENALLYHSNLLRACFVIAFVYDARVRRFVMAQHSIHTHYMQTRPPAPDSAQRFISDVAPIINDFLFTGRISLLEMVEMCCDRWLSHYMIHTTQTPLTKNIEVNT